MTLTEPATLITDYLLALVALGCAWALLRRPGRAVRGWGWALGALGVGAIAGGTHHGFAPMLGEWGNWITWKLTLWSIGAMSVLMLLALTASASTGTRRRWLVAATALQGALYFAWTATHDAFLWAIVEYGVALVAALGVGIYRGWVRKEPGGRWLIAAVLVTVIASGIQQSGFDLHPRFNHNDLYHVVQMLGIYLLYRGGRELRDA